jgi:hypothetical protein
MGLVDIIWGSKDNNPTPKDLRRLPKDGWRLVKLHGARFTDANVKIHILQSNSSSVSARMVVEEGIMDMLESSIESFIKQDYPYDHIPVDSAAVEDSLDFMVDMNPKTPIKHKTSKSDNTYVVKDLWTMGQGITLHGKVTISIDKVYFEYRELDGEFIEGTQSFRYSDPEIEDIDDEMFHWTYFD